MTDDRAAIDAVIQIYLDGLYEGDCGKLADAFLPTSALTSEQDGKLVVVPRDAWLEASFIASNGIRLLPIRSEHALALVDPEPPTRDPFDRMLLAQCQVKDLRLVTVDRALVDHPLA